MGFKNAMLMFINSIFGNEQGMNIKTDLISSCDKHC